NRRACLSVSRARRLVCVIAGFLLIHGRMMFAFRQAISRRSSREDTMSKTIRQTATFKTSPHEVYEALMDSRKHSKFTGAPAKLSRKVGGEFTAFGGSLSGKTTELVADKKILQEWRADDWPAGH